MKNLKHIIIIFIFTCVFFRTNAQNAIFLSQGRIEFERRLNVYAINDEMDIKMDESWKKIAPQFEASYFDLKFHNGKTLYAPGRENADNNNSWQMPAEDNIVFSDLDKRQSISKKNVYDLSFLVSDSTRSIQWKITDETRTIAGFECRRANAVIMDSIYIVAFYTDEITTTGGPESFNGLPGMILGVAIPHEHITWFATKVFSETIADVNLIAPVKGKKTTNAGLKNAIKESLKSWGKNGLPYFKEIMF